MGRLNADGSADTGFDLKGYKEYTTDTGTENKCSDLQLLPDGKVILGGWIMNRETKKYNFGLMRIKTDGDIDTSFGKKGKVLTQLTLSGMHLLNNNLYKILLQPDGKILGLGEAPNPDYLITSSVPEAWGMVRYEANGHTGINSLPNAHTSTLYPNPVQSYFTISSTSDLNRLQLLSMEGKLIRQWEQPSPNTQFYMADLPAGMYIVKLMYTHNSQSFIKITH